MELVKAMYIDVHNITIQFETKHAGVDLFFDKAEELPFTFQLESGSALNVTFMMVQHRGLIVFMLSLSRGGWVRII